MQSLLSEFEGIEDLGVDDIFGSFAIDQADDIRDHDLGLMGGNFWRWRRRYEGAG